LRARVDQECRVAVAGGLIEKPREPEDVAEHKVRIGAVRPASHEIRGEVVRLDGLSALEPADDEARSGAEIARVER